MPTQQYYKIKSLGVLTGQRRVGVHTEGLGGSRSTAKEFLTSPRSILCFSPQPIAAPSRRLVRSPRWRRRRVSPVGGAGAGRVSIAAVSHWGTSRSEAASPGAASTDAPLGKAAEGGPGKRRKPSKGRDKSGLCSGRCAAPGWPAGPVHCGGAACVCGGAAPDPPLKRAGSSRRRGGGRYHPPPGGGVRTPPEAGEVEVAGAGSRRVLGCSDCSTPSGGVFVFLEAPCSFCWG